MLSFETFESPLPKNALCQYYLPSGSGEQDENAESSQTDRRTDGRQAIRKAHLSS